MCLILAIGLILATGRILADVPILVNGLVLVNGRILDQRSYHGPTINLVPLVLPWANGLKLAQWSQISSMASDQLNGLRLVQWS